MKINPIIWLLPLAQLACAAPAINVQPALTFANPGFPVTLTVAATATSGTLSYAWSRNDVPLADNQFISGSSGPRLVISPARPADAGTYKVVVTDDSGSTPSHEATLVLDQAIPQITAEPVDVTVASGSAVDFSVSAIDASTYQWFLGETPLSDGGKYSGTTTSALQIAGASQVDNGTYTVRITNPRGSISSRAARLTATLGTPEGDALDASTVSISNPHGWLLQGDHTSDGIDALRSAQITHDQTTEANCTLYGPGVLSFQWWVNSENPDRLRFFADNSEVASISGQPVGWAPISRFVPQGNHLARWIYSKDHSVHTGLDAGFIDRFSFIPFTLSSVEEAIDQRFPNPLAYGGTGLRWYGQSHTTHDGTDAVRSPVIGDYGSAWFETTVTGPGQVVFWAKSSSEGPDFLRLRVDGADVYRLSGDSDWREVSHWIGWGQHTLRWSYEKDHSVASLQDAVWVDEIRYTPVTFSSLADAADDTLLQWQTDGSSPWFGQSHFTSDGVDALQAGPISDNGTSRIKAIVTGPGTLSFRWRTNSEGPDYLRFYLDGTRNGSISGEGDWTDVSIVLEGPGSRQLMWEYTKDHSVARGEDTGWIDQVTFTPQRDPVTLTVAPSPYGSPIPAPGIHTYEWGSPVNCSVEPITNGLTQYTCVGWTGTGSVPASGTTNQVTIPSIELNSSITWNWSTNHWLNVALTGNGTLSHSSGFYPEGSTQNLIATPATGWLFMGWAGDATGNNPSTPLVLDSPKTITAVFSDDADSDGLTNEQEAILGSNPRKRDTDDDGFDDKLEADNGGSPIISDAWRVDHIRANGQDFGLFPSDVVLDVAVGQLLFEVTGGNTTLSLQLQESTDLINWNNSGDPVNWTRAVNAAQKYYRIRFTK